MMRIAPKGNRRVKGESRILTRRNWGVSMEHRIGKINRSTTGWVGYFRLADSEGTFRDLDGWIRGRLRQIRWKEWKSTAAKRHNLRIRGISERNARKWAGSSKGYWRGGVATFPHVSLAENYSKRPVPHILIATTDGLNQA